MSVEYFFAVTNTRIKGGEKTAKKRDKIAKTITYYFDKARHEWKGWGFIKNRGEPFNQNVSKKIIDAWKAQEME